jgi:hypothetical protein
LGAGFVAGGAGFAGGFLLGALGGLVDASGFGGGGASRHFKTHASDAFLHSSTHATTWSQAKSQSVSMLWQRVSHS